MLKLIQVLCDNGYDYEEYENNLNIRCWSLRQTMTGELARLWHIMDGSYLVVWDKAVKVANGSRVDYKLLNAHVHNVDELDLVLKGFMYKLCIEQDPNLIPASEVPGWVMPGWKDELTYCPNCGSKTRVSQIEQWGACENCRAQAEEEACQDQ